MAGHLMILNPKRRSRGKARTGGRRKMTAKQLQYFGPRRKGAKRRKAKTVLIATTNPRRKRTVKRRKHRNSAKRATRRFARNPRVRRRHFRRNPIGATMLTGSFVNAGIGAAGALAVDFLIANLPLPVSMQSGPMLSAVRFGAALGLGFAASQVAGRQAGVEVAAGGMIVTTYQIAKNFLSQNAPNVRLARYVPLRGMGCNNGLGVIRRRRRMARFVPMRGMGKMGRMNRFVPLRGMAANPAMVNFVRRGRQGLGYVSPARVSRGGLRFLGCN